MAETFVCAGCGAALTAALSRVALPVHVHQRYGHELLPALMEQGTYAVAPEPSGPPWKPWDEIGAEAAAARGVFAVLAGPGLTGPGPAPGIALVPVHPRTGGTWQPPGAAKPVPLPADVWTYLAFHDDRLSVPATGGLPREVCRDDPPPPHPWGPFRPGAEVFLYTLARLPAVRLPWLRAIYDRVRERPYAVL
ncbi:hypothetical protein ACFVWY_00690 [Streptomyces sp. NPDC058195]|uniref:hypothetical protein n=1 Tax=Streptomyces sp. NPDC058195 TaxID=3346375 RepID=UPI0036E34E4D